MSEVTIGTEKNQAKGKWNLSNFVYLQEGRKKRISRTFLKVTSFCLGLLFIGLQLISALKSESPTLNSIGVSPPNEVSDNVIDLEIFDKKKFTREKFVVTRPIFFETIKPVNLKSQTAIPSGTEAMALLVSGGSNGIVKAKISDAVTMNGETIIEKGATLLGLGTSSDERLFVNFYKLVSAAGKDLKIKAQAFDSKDRILGLKGEKISDFAFRIAASSGLFFLGGMAEGMQESDGYLPKKKSVKDAALQGVTQATIEQGREMMNSMNNKSVIEVKHSTSIIVIFDNGEPNE